jgi:IS30 family transposase
MDYADDKSMRISAEAIYQYIYVLPRGELKATLVAGLRQEHRHRRKRKALEGKNAEKRARSPRCCRLKSVRRRWRTGRCPGIGRVISFGKNKRTALGTLVELVTRYTLLIALEARDAETVRAAYAKALSKLPRALARSLTYDQGKEMSGHKAFTIATGMKVYFARPSSLWERGAMKTLTAWCASSSPEGRNSINYRPGQFFGHRTY